jgi:hypothetical protein
MKSIAARPFALTLLILSFSLVIADPSACAQSDPPRLEIGPQFSGLHLHYRFVGREGIEEIADDNWFGFGGWIGYNVTRRIAIEGAVTKFKTDEILPRTFSTSAQPDIQGLFGVKAGVRRSKYGVFGKVRPGFTRFTPVFDCPAIDFSTCTQESHTGFSLDAGAVVEGYLSRRFLVRGDFGATYLHHPKTTLFFPGEPDVPPFQFSNPGFRKVVPQFSVGFGFRF